MPNHPARPIISGTDRDSGDPIREDVGAAWVLPPITRASLAADAGGTPARTGWQDDLAADLAAVPVTDFAARQSVVDERFRTDEEEAELLAAHHAAADRARVRRAADREARRAAEVQVAVMATAPHRPSVVTRILDRWR